MAGTDSEFLFGVGGVQAPSLILAPWLYLGDASIAFTNAALKSLGITHIVPVMPEFHKPPYPNVKTCFSCVAYYQDFQYHHVVALDRPDQDLLQFFPECCKFIDAAKATNGRVLIHCGAGISRSSAVCCAYLMWDFYRLRRGNENIARMTGKEALAIIRKSRVQAWPNDGFMTQLEQWRIQLESTYPTPS